jgi:hypothetical protein
VLDILTSSDPSICEPRRMTSLEVLLRHLARAGIDAGMGLCERDGRLRSTYTWGLLVASTASLAAGESDASQTAGAQ